MSRLRTLRWVYGQLVPGLESALASALDVMVDDAVVAAVSSWSADGWRSFDDHEANRTMQLYKWIEEAVHVNPSLRSLTPRLEWVQPTPGMYAGTESATKVPRPDIRLAVGAAAGITLECKRLSLGSQHPSRYVNEGMKRFVSGEYAAAEAQGRMVGYIEADDEADILAAVNAAVVSSPSMGANHVLHVFALDAPSLHRYRSEHTREKSPPIRLVHHWIDVAG
jgi:hypothetical protein